MKTKLLFAMLLSFGASVEASAEARLLLQCNLDIAPITAVKVIASGGSLVIHEKRLGYSFTARPLPAAEWSARSINLQDPEDEITGVLRKEGNGWNYTFTRSDGWRMSAGAECFEARD